MCSPKTPKAPAPAPKQDPRILLSRKQFDDLLISPSGGTGSGTRTSSAGMDAGFAGGSGGGVAAAGLRIPR